MSILMRQAAKEFGGIHSVLIDWVADAVHDVNDADEAGTLITELHGLAIEFDCPILGVIHVNPGSDFKTRSHLGSQLERKSETNLRLEKGEGGSTVIWADKNRRAPIPKDTAPCFAWDDNAGMHLGVATIRSIKDERKKRGLRAEAMAVFAAAKQPLMTHGQIVRIISRERDVSVSTAKRDLHEMIDFGIVLKDLTGLYRLNS